MTKHADNTTPMTTPQLRPVTNTTPTETCILSPFAIITIFTKPKTERGQELDDRTAALTFDRFVNFD